MGDDVVLGIDLGTTNSVVAVADAGEAMVLADLDGKRLVPSVVSFAPDQVHVGDVARERRLIDAENTVYAMKRLIGRPYDSAEVRRAQERFAFRIIESDNGGVRVVGQDRAYALAEISAYVLRECRRIAELVLGHETKRAVITVPANFNELQRSATKAAGMVAGLDVVRILNEPTAAAVAYGCGTSGAERVAVFDLGGGTFDITILELDGDVFEVVSTAGDTFLGGDDIDLLIAEEMAFAFERDTGIDPRPHRQAFERLRAAGEWVKCQLSFQQDVVARLEEVLSEDGRAIPLAFRMTRMQLEEHITPLLDRAMAVTERALESGGTKIEEIDTVVLVGGSTRIPLVRQRVAELFGKKPRIDIDPDLVVALGAAVQGYALSHKRARKTITVFPSAEAVAEVKRQKEAARAARPKQPAFAPQAYRPPSPSSTQPGAGGPAAEGMGPLQASQRPGAAGSTRPGGRGAPTSDGRGPLQSAPPMELQVEDLEQVAASEAPSQPLSAEPRNLSRDEIAAALFSSGPPPAPPHPPEQSDEELGFASTNVASTPPKDPPTTELTFDPQDASEGPVSRAGFAAANIAALSLDLPPPSRHASRQNDPLLDGQSLIDLPEPTDAIAPPAQPSPLRSQLRGSDLFDSPAAVEAEVLGSSPALLGAEYDNPAEGRVGIPMPEGAPPILMDVTPLSLGIQTAGGYCERVIGNNTPIPIEQARMFTTARDDQEQVQIAICQGESRVYGENQHLGEIELSGLPRGKRGKVRIQVTFMLDADGRLDVDATDQATGQSQKIRISLVGGYDDGELQAMRQRQEGG